MEKLSVDEITLLKILSDGKSYNTATLMKKLKWTRAKVNRIRKSLESHGLIKKQRLGNIYFYSLLFASAGVFLTTYGIMKTSDKKLKDLILQEQSQRISADRYLDDRLTIQEISFMNMVDDLRYEEQLNNMETMQLINNLQNEDSVIKQDILRKHNLTQRDIQNLRLTVNLNDLYYMSKFEQGTYERMVLGQRLTLEEQQRLYGERVIHGRIGTAEGRIKSTEKGLHDIRGSISDIYEYLEEDDDDDESNSGTDPGGDPVGSPSGGSRAEQDYYKTHPGGTPHGRKPPPYKRDDNITDDFFKWLRGK